MLVTLKEILNYAEANKCAIGAFHIPVSYTHLLSIRDSDRILHVHRSALL